jgi:hypothetical protein
MPVVSIRSQARSRVLEDVCAVPSRARLSHKPRAQAGAGSRQSRAWPSPLPRPPCTGQNANSIHEQERAPLRQIRDDLSGQPAEAMDRLQRLCVVHGLS